MSIEQIVFLILFLVVPIFQALKGALEKKRAQKLETELEADAEPVSDWPPPRDFPVEATPVPTPVPPARPPPPLPRSEPAPRPRAPAVEQRRPSGARPPAPAPRRPLRPQHALVLADRLSLRRAIVSMAVFGPPRALDPYRADRNGPI